MRPARGEVIVFSRRADPLAGRPRRLRAAVLAFALVLPAAGCGSKPEQTAALGVAQAQSSSRTGVLPMERRAHVPKLSGEKVGGGPLEVIAAGQVLVINTWGSWCAPCRAEARNLEHVYEQTRASGVSFVGINVRDNDAAAAAFQRTYSVSYPSFRDQDGTIVARFRELPPSAIPSTLVVDRAGRTAARFIGAVTVDDLLTVVRQVAAERVGLAQ